MGKFVHFFAEGIIYIRDKKGRPCDVKESFTSDGITLNSAELMGSIFKQCPDLLPCDYVSVTTNPIG